MSNRTRLPLILAQALALGALATMAAAEIDPAVDLDGDGNYSFPELQAVVAEMTDEAFITIDANGDGLLDEAEVAAATEAGLLVMPDAG